MLQQINIGWLADEAMAHFYVTWTIVWNALHTPIGNQITWHATLVSTSRLLAGASF
jgi:hypothetical protein